MDCSSCWDASFFGKCSLTAQQLTAAAVTPPAEHAARRAAGAANAAAADADGRLIGLS
jgi:hypothetical protein